MPHLGFETISAGTVLRDEGDPQCSLLIVVSREVRLSHADNELNKLSPGKIFGEGTSIEKAEATVDSVIARLEIRNFDQFLQQSPKSAQKLKNYFKELPLKRLHEVEGLSFMDSRKFLALVAHNEMK